MASPFEYFWNIYAKSVYDEKTLKKINPKLHMVLEEIEQPEKDPNEDYYPCPLCKIPTGEDELLDNSANCTKCTDRLFKRHYSKHVICSSFSG